MHNTSLHSYLPDSEQWPFLLNEFSNMALSFLQELESKPVATLEPHLPIHGLPVAGKSLAKLMAQVQSQVLPQMSASRGPRYWGFVTGGATPVATFADWMVGLLDQNVSKDGDLHMDVP